MPDGDEGEPIKASLVFDDAGSCFSFRPVLVTGFDAPRVFIQKTKPDD